jgi:hypothetical protein
MAPEVVLGRSYNQSVDVYSFSVLIWQITTGFHLVSSVSRIYVFAFVLGKIPFVNLGKKQFFDKVVVGGTRLKLEKNWPVEFRTLLSRCWSEDKNLRPDFKMILTELEEVILEQERLEELKSKQCNRRWMSFLSLFLRRSGPLWLLIFFILLLYAMTLVIAQNNLALGAALCMISVCFIYVIGASYLQVWYCEGKVFVGNGGSDLEFEQISAHNVGSLRTKSGDNLMQSGLSNETDRSIVSQQMFTRNGSNEYAFNPIVNQMAQRSNVNL